MATHSFIYQQLGIINAAAQAVRELHAALATEIQTNDGSIQPENYAPYHEAIADATELHQRLNNAISFAKVQGL